MKDKFRENFGIAVPAAIVTMMIIFFKSQKAGFGNAITNDYNLVQIIPYILVLIGGILGVNVFVVLFIGIVCGTIVMLATHAATVPDLLVNMGNGVSGMFETSMVAILVSAICALINENGGFAALLQLIKKVFKGKKAGTLGMGLLVGAMDIATANNTVAIVMANPIAKEMAETYGIMPKKAASILDTFSCIFQGIIPYGAQLLVAVSVAARLGCQVSAFQIMSNLFYPFMLLISSLIFIFIVPAKRSKKIANGVG